MSVPRRVAIVTGAASGGRARYICNLYSPELGRPQHGVYVTLLKPFTQLPVPLQGNSHLRKNCIVLLQCDTSNVMSFSNHKRTEIR